MALAALLIGCGVIVLLIAVCISRPIFMVQQGEAVVVQRLGKFHRVLQPGLRWIIPLFETCRSVSWHHSVERRSTITGAPVWVTEEYADYRVPTGVTQWAMEPVECTTRDHHQPTVTVSFKVVIEQPQVAVYVKELVREMETDIVAELERSVLALDRATVDHARLTVALKSKLGEMPWREALGVKLVKVHVDHIEWPSTSLASHRMEREQGARDEDLNQTRNFLAMLRESGLSDPVLVAFIQTSALRSDV